MPPTRRIETWAEACLDEPLPVDELHAAACLDELFVPGKIETRAQWMARADAVLASQRHDGMSHAELVERRDLLAFTAEELRAHEADLRRVPMNYGAFSAGSGSPSERLVHRRFLTAMASTAAIFRFDERVGEVLGAPFDPDERVPFPPLPFSRVWVECADEHGAPTPLFAATPSQREEYEVRDILVTYLAISESEPGERWDLAVGLLLEQVDGVRTPGFLCERITPDGWAAHDEDIDMDADRAMFGFIRKVVVNAAHLLTARSVTYTGVPWPRAHRRALERAGAPSEPRLYVVNMAEAGDIRPGTTDREYHCRWLVRGHWRQYASGHRAWVRPYIKGPPGAPWKGRPVHEAAVASEGGSG